MATTTWDQALLCVYLPDVHAEDNYNANNADLQKKLTTMTLVRRYIAPWWHITILKLQALLSWLLETPIPVRGVIVGGWGSLGWKERGHEGVMCKAWLGLKAPKKAKIEQISVWQKRKNSSHHKHVLLPYTGLCRATPQIFSRKRCLPCMWSSILCRRVWFLGCWQTSNQTQANLIPNILAILTRSNAYLPIAHQYSTNINIGCFKRGPANSYFFTAKRRTWMWYIFRWTISYHHG